MAHFARSDGASNTITCDSAQRAQDAHHECIPGCQALSARECNWCSDRSRAGLPCLNWGRCAYRPNELRAMLTAYPHNGGYNELVISADSFEAALPSVIEAFFFLPR